MSVAKLISYWNWLFQIRIVIHGLGTISIFCFIASLYTQHLLFRSSLRRLSTYFTVFYFVLNAYILWWSDNVTKNFSTFLWTHFIHAHAMISFLVCSGFALEKFLTQSCLGAMYFVAFRFILDRFSLFSKDQSNVNFWLFIDYLIDDFALFCGYFYLYQFSQHQKISVKKHE